MLIYQRRRFCRVTRPLSPSFVKERFVLATWHNFQRPLPSQDAYLSTFGIKGCSRMGLLSTTCYTWMIRCAVFFFCIRELSCGGSAVRVHMKKAADSVDVKYAPLWHLPWLGLPSRLGWGSFAAQFSWFLAGHLSCTRPLRSCSNNIKGCSAVGKTSS